MTRNAPRSDSADEQQQKYFYYYSARDVRREKKTNFVQKNEDCIMKTLHYINFGLSVSMSIDDALYTTNCVVYICIKLNRESFDLIHLYTITVQHTPKRWQFFFTFCFFILAAACFRCLVFSLFVVFSFKFFFCALCLCAFAFIRFYCCFRVFDLFLTDARFVLQPSFDVRWYGCAVVA